MSSQKRRRAVVEKEIRVRKVNTSIPRDSAAYQELVEDLTSMGCVGLLRRPWRIRTEGVVEELLTREVPPEFVKTIRGLPEEWTPEVRRQVYNLEHGADGMAAKKDFCLQG